MDWNCKTVFIFIFYLGCSSHCFLTEHIGPEDGDKEQIPFKSSRVKRSEPIIYDIYALDHFIELVEKIERNTNTSEDTLKKVANYVRLLGHDNELFNILCGKADPLPQGVLISEEERVITQMVTYSFDDSSNEEQGVVSTANQETVAMGRVLTGICAGLVREKSVSLTKWAPGSPYIVDNLYAATIAHDLAMSALFSKNAGKNTLFGPSGVWFPNMNCSQRYNLNNGYRVTKATDALILGGIDGFLLGYGLPSWESKGVRLGQVLRMYYGSGILYDTSYVSCKRNSKFKSLVDKDKLVDQVQAFAYALYDKHSSQLLNVKKDDITNLVKHLGQAFFPYFDSMSRNLYCRFDEEEEECEIPANIVFVMDESGSIGFQNYEKEKAFVSQLIETFDISPFQARVAIVEYSNRASLSVALDNYGSKTRLMCAVNDLRYSDGQTNTGHALEVVQHNVLRPALTHPVGDTETVQIVIVLTDGKSNGDVSLDRAATNLKEDIKDLTVIAVGVASYNLDELKLIATDEEAHVFTATNFDRLIQLVKSLRKKACSAPLYLAMNFTNTEDGTEVVAFVSPNKARFFTVPSEHFFGVEHIYIDVIPQYGTVTVYASRTTATPGPNNHSQKLGPAGEGDTMQLELTDLCTGYNSSETCPPIHIGIYGEASYLTCSERDCNLPNQIKFKIRRGIPPSTAHTTRTEVRLFVQVVFFAIAINFSL